MKIAITVLTITLAELLAFISTAYSESLGDSGSCESAMECRERISNYEKQIRELSGNSVTTERGMEFVRDWGLPKLGDAWRDPGDTIWGAPAKDGSGQLLLKSRDEALEYCKSIHYKILYTRPEFDVRLPTSTDWGRLAIFLGKRSLIQDGFGPISFIGKDNEGYTPMGIPDIEAFFWSSRYDDFESPTVLGRLFDGKTGWQHDVGLGHGSNSRAAVRCIARRNGIGVSQIGGQRWGELEYFEKNRDQIEAIQKKIEIVEHKIEELEGDRYPLGNGRELVRDNSIRALGNAWRDPDGAIWGDIAKHSDKTIRQMTQPEALEYCNEINRSLPGRISSKYGVRLPLRQDWHVLRTFLSTGSSSPDSNAPLSGYSHQGLPNLNLVVKGQLLARATGTFFWSASAILDKYAVSFNGRTGEFFEAAKNEPGSVRCVAYKKGD